MESVTRTLNGAWIGSLEFADDRLPVPFEANLTTAGEGGAIYGRASDLGPSGSALIEGHVVGKSVNFITYNISAKTAEKVGKTEFVGIISDDGASIAGTWKSDSGPDALGSGSWHIFRAGTDRVVAGRPWPPPQSKSIRTALPPPDEMMVARAYGQTMTITHAGSSISSRGKKSPSGIAFALCIFCLTLTIALAFALLSKGISLGLGVSFLVALTCTSIFAWIAIRTKSGSLEADIYILDREKNSVTRNTKLIGQMEQIAKIEVKAIRDGTDTSTVTIVMHNSRRVFIDTGRTIGALALANDIGQFTGVDVVAIG